MQLLTIDVLLYQLMSYSLIIDAENLKQPGASPPCPSDLFHCDNNRCLPYAFVCNGEVNCHDHTDELNCSTTFDTDDLCPRKFAVHCEQDLFRDTHLVEHGIHKETTQPLHICIKRSAVCDGIIDCRHAIDEQCAEKNPLIVCAEEEYHCQVTNRCIPKAWRCNGINDCLDPFASDELECPMVGKCTANEFACRSVHQCVPSTAVCDGVQDCVDGSDESSTFCLFPRFCTRDQFACKSTKLCIPQANICDTISQCHDRSDEMFCSCPLDDYISRKLFYRCGSTDKCLPKDVECHVKRQCLTSMLEDDDNQAECPLMNRTCSTSRPCSGKNQYCDRYQRCVCEQGYRMNETTGLCHDIDECRERAVCDHYCTNTLGSYRCSCREHYQLKPDKHACQLRTSGLSADLYGLFNNGIYKLKLNDDNDIVLDNQMLVTLTEHAYLLDYDPLEKYLYFAECTVPIRPILITCAKTRGIFRVHLNRSTPRKELIITGRDYTSVQSLAIDWLHRNIYFVSTLSRTINVCRLNGSFCRVLLHQTFSDYLPQRIVLYPEKGLLFYTATAKSRAQHVVRLGMDGTNFQLLFTIGTANDGENADYLRSLLTIDRISHHLYFYNGLDKIWVLNMRGDVLHVQYEARQQFHSFEVFADKIYRAFADVERTNRSQLRIHAKYALGTAIIQPDKNVSFETRTSLLNPLRSQYFSQHPLHTTGFLIVDPHETKEPEGRCDQCDQLCFPHARNQVEIFCACAGHYHLADDGRSCISDCPEHFFHCPLSKKCIPFYQRCDGTVDCVFNEDESHCQGCDTISSFRCSNSSRCISTADLCNSITDCVHGEDEDDRLCRQFCAWPSLHRCPKKYPSLCSNEEFHCDGQCVSITHRCDGTPYCYDGADEPLDCVNVTCPSEYFKCPLSGKCIAYERVCDNIDDCPLVDRIDHISADESSGACSLMANHPVNRTRSTLTQTHMTCESADLFRCKTSNVCINRTYVCDGDLDCSDSSDEENCVNAHTNGIMSSLMHKDYTCMNGYRCALQRHKLDDSNSLCIPLSQLCDGISQCPLGDDEHQWRCRDCAGCDLTSSVCELINRLPTCQCKTGYIKTSNGSCILEDASCSWSFGLCAHQNFSRTTDYRNACVARNSSFPCRCDSGYDIRQNDGGRMSCVARATDSLDIMLNPRTSFYLYQHTSIFAPVNPSHHLIDAAFIPCDSTTWCVLYTEQRYGHGYIWQQKLNRQLNSPDRSTNNATQIWSSSLFLFTSLDVDWIHRLVYALYEDPFSSTNGIEIMHAPTTDYTHLILVNRLTFSNTKTISSIKVQPLQEYLYITAYYDAQHSFVYRSLLDGSNLEVFATLHYPALSMAIDYRHPRLYVMLSNGEIESYATDSSQPWRTSVYHVRNDRPYSIDIHDDTLVVMVSNATDSTYDEIWIDKFGTSVTGKSRKLKTPTIVRYLHEFKYPTAHTSNMVRPVCSPSSCSTDRICISTPSHQPLCIIPGQTNLCGSSCRTRGICSNGHCVCSNRTYVGDDCELCRLTDTITAGCFHVGNDAQPSCMCYLSQSKTRRTPYLCMTLHNERRETEVPCDRVVSPIERETCSRTLFTEPACGETSHSLIYHVQTQRCLCRETMNRKINCLNNGLLVIDDNENTSSCSCSSPFSGNRCQWSPCSNHCQNNGTCTLNGTTPTCTCLNGFTGTQCHQNLCLTIACENGGACFVKENKPFCRCATGFTGHHCHMEHRARWYFWLLTAMTTAMLAALAYTFARYNSKFIRLKYLFVYRRLQEQIGLEISSTQTIYSHVPTSDPTGDDHQHQSVLEMASTSINDTPVVCFEDPFYIDEKQPMFTPERTSTMRT